MLPSAESESDVSIRFWGAPVPILLGSSGSLRFSADDVVVLLLEVHGSRLRLAQAMWGCRVVCETEGGCGIPIVFHTSSLASGVPMSLASNWCSGEVSIMGCIGARSH